MPLTKVTLSMVEAGLACIEDFGASVSASAADNKIAIDAALAYASVNKVNLTAVTIGVFNVTGTITIPANVTFIGRKDGAKPTLKWGVGASPSNLSTRAAIILGGVNSAVLGWNINMETDGDFRRTISAGGFDNQTASHNVITLALTAIPSNLDHSAIFSSAFSVFYNANFSYNEITGTANAGLNGILMAYAVNACVTNNYIHDLVRGPDPGSQASGRFYWGIYCSTKSYGIDIANNNINNLTNMSGIRVSNAGEGVQFDFGRRVSNNYINTVTYVGLSLDALKGATAVNNIVISAGLLATIIASQGVSFVSGTLSNMVEASPIISANKPIMQVESSTDTQVSGVTFDVAGDAVVCFYTDSSGVSISDITATVNAPVGVIQTGSATTDISISNVVAAQPTATTTGSRIFIGKDRTIITGCRIACSATGQIGIRVAGTRNIVNGNVITGGTNGIWLTSTSSNSLAVNNNVSGSSSTAILDSGASNTLANNIT